MKGKGKRMRKRMTEQNYRAIKLMANGGATLDVINEYYPVSKETLRRIKRTVNFAEYKKMQDDYSTRSAANLMKREEQPQETPETQELPNQISMDDLTHKSETVELLKEQNDLLRRLVNDVAFIVSELTGKGEV